MARPRSFDETTVLERSRDLFWRKGYADTSINDLEAATGLKRTSLYAAFGSKQALYLKALGSYQLDNRHQMAELFQRINDPIARIEQLLATSVETALTDPLRKGCFMGNAAAERGCICPETTQLLNNNRIDLVRIFREQLNQALQRGNLTRPTEPLAHYLFVLHSGLMNTIRSGADPTAVRAALRAGLQIFRPHDPTAA